MRRIIRVIRIPSPDLPPLQVTAHGPAPGDRGMLAIGSVVGDERSFPFPGGMVLPLEHLPALREMLDEIDAVLRLDDPPALNEIVDAWAEL